MNSLPVYEFFVALGYIAAIAVLYFQSRRNWENLQSFALFIVGASLSTFWGARVLGDLVDAHVAGSLTWESLDLFIVDKASGSLVFYGGLLSLLLYFYLLSRFRNKPFIKLLDMFVPALCVAQALGRIGCWARGCCFGDICPYPWGVLRENHIAPIHPVQLYEAALLFVLFVFFVRPWSKAWPSKGLVFLWLYPSFRFLIEFLRGDEVRGYWGPLSTSQWISLFLLILAGFLSYQNKNHNKRGAASPQ